MGKVDMDGYIMILLYIFKFNAPLMDVMTNEYHRNSSQTPFYSGRPMKERISL